MKRTIDGALITENYPHCKKNAECIRHELHVLYETSCWRHDGTVIVEEVSNE